MGSSVSSNRPGGPNYSGYSGNGPAAGSTPAGSGAAATPLPPLAHEDAHARDHCGDVLRGAPPKDLYLYDFPSGSACQAELQKRMMEDQKVLQQEMEIAKLPPSVRDQIPRRDLKDLPTSARVNCDPDVALRKQAELQQQLKQLQEQFEIQKLNQNKIRDQIR